jgi:hypothetical protein
MYAEIDEVHKTADGWVGIGELMESDKMVLTATRVTIRLDEESAEACREAILDGEGRVEKFEVDKVVGLALPMGHR